MSETQERPRRRSVVSWVLYDFANTMFSFNITSFFFAQWLINEMGGTDSSYATASSVAMLVIVLLSPFLGALTDHAPRRMPFLVVSSLVCITATALLGRFGVPASLVLFGVSIVGYQAGLQFYDSLLPVVSTPENRGRVSGLGIGAGYAGALIGFGVGFLMTHDAAEGERAGRYVDLFAVTAGLFLVFATPCFVFVRERARAGRHFGARAMADAGRQVVRTVRSLRRRPNLSRFLVGRVLYTDAVNTVIAFLGIYVTNEVGMTPVESQIVLGVAIVSAAAGGFVWSAVVDRIGHKAALLRVMWIWVAVFAWTALVGFLRLPPIIFWPVPALAGIALAGTWSADRPLMLALTPADRVGEYYGLYGMSGRVSAVLGPLLWAFVAEGLGLGRPAAVAVLLVFVFLAIGILRPLSAEKDVDPEPAPGV